MFTRVDLYDVQDQDVATPLVVMKKVYSAIGLIERVDLVVRSQHIRVAATTAGNILGLKLTVRSVR